MRRARPVPALVVSLLLGGAACGGGGDDEDGATDSVTVSAAEDGGDDDAGAVTLPAPCTLAPFTATVERTGPSPAGSATFEVVDAVVQPIPIVPDPNQELGVEEAFEAAATTDLLGYAILLADEDIDDASVSLFSGYEPSVEGKVRAFVSVYPSSADAPLAVGDVVTHSFETELGTFTTLSTIGLDLSTSAEELNSYLDAPVGQVEVLALTDDAACFDVDLSWSLSAGGSDAEGTVTIRGVLAGPLLPRGNLPLS